MVRPVEGYEMPFLRAVAEEGEAVVARRGFVIVRGFFGDEELGPLWRDTNDLVDAFASAAGVTIPKAPGREGDRRVAELLRLRPDAQPVLYDRLQQMPSLLALANHDRVRALARFYLGAERVGVWPRMQLRLDRYADQKNVIEWHHDYLYNKGTKHSYTFWMPIVDMTAAMGQLLIADGSHRHSGVEFTRTADEHRFDYTLPPEVVAELSVLAPDVHAGDLVVFHSLLLHSGQLNRDPSRARLSALFRMQDLDRLEAFDTWRMAHGTPGTSG